MTLKVVRTLAEADWRRFVDEHPDANIYHTPDMFRVFETTAGYDPTLWAVVDSSNQPLALLLPVNITLMDGLLRRFTTRAVVYGSILVSPTPPGRQALSLLLETYQNETKNSALFTELRNMSDLSTQQTFLNEKKFIFEDHLNFLIDLTQAEDQLWQNVKKKCRQHIRTSRNKGTQVHRITDRSELTAAYTILQQVYARSQVPLSDLSLFEAAFD
ncbi:MAG: peptidoglycan bridge formation glycyltransferase FemA/FemB family protein, partial [Anaerolineae bacterium]|nr:peptidoglycan bridge formation glycyltransferase FemA/FemB family protein [Anaerolineae bacterium]